ncbi:MAG: hypothetical protein M3Z06_11475, partial [Actinomycetota bacterium]|nr:hypothetical protein [Actinomycetota bacterium]
MSAAAASADARGPEAAVAAGPSRGADGAAYAPTLVLTATLALAGFIVLMSAVLLVVHPAGGAGALAAQVILQKQSAKTALYLASFLLVLPLALIAGPRLADKLAAGPGASSLAALAAALAGTLAATIIAVRLSASLPWGDGLGAMLVAMAVWWALALALLAGA